MRRVARAGLRCCSFRNFFALCGGSVLALVPLVSIGPAIRSIEMVPYAPQYPHQAYGYELALTRLQRNAPAIEWFDGAERALKDPLPVELPFRKTGEQASAAAAVGYAFTVPVGRRVAVTLTMQLPGCFER